MSAFLVRMNTFTCLQGEDICMALQTHINDIMMKRYSKARFGTTAWEGCLLA